MTAAPGRSRVVGTTAGPAHYVDFGGSGPTLVCVHGLGGSWVNWLAVGPRLAQRAHVMALDLIGFESTPTAGRRAGLRSQRRLVGHL